MSINGNLFHHIGRTGGALVARSKLFCDGGFPGYREANVFCCLQVGGYFCWQSLAAQDYTIAYNYLWPRVWRLSGRSWPGSGTGTGDTVSNMQFGDIFWPVERRGG